MTCSLAFSFYSLIVTYKEKSERTQLVKMKMNGRWGEKRRGGGEEESKWMDGWMDVLAKLNSGWGWNGQPKTSRDSKVSQ